MGYPVMIKATAGGGGRGMRLVRSADELENLFKAAQGEAEAIENVFGAIHKGDPTNDLIAIKYLEALRFTSDALKLQTH